MNQDDLLYRILELLVEHSPDDDVCDLAWGAVNGDDELDAAMDGAHPDRPQRAERALAPAGAFLTSLAVEGFRGIGSKAMINFKPGPGLVVVTGRNGSGKSSLAEGFEYALTSTTYRWKLSTRFAEQWRNLHHPEPCCITVGLAQEAVGSSTIEASWPAGSSSTSDARVTYQPYGQARRDGIAELGWATALETYRPILSYEELGRLLNEKNAQLHDSLRLMLGLDALTAAERRLKTRLDPIKQPLAVADRERKSLRAQAESCSDERAVRAATMLRHTRPDVSKIQALVTGATDTTPFVRALRTSPESNSRLPNRSSRSPPDSPTRSLRNERSGITPPRWRIGDGRCWRRLCTLPTPQRQTCHVRCGSKESSTRIGVPARQSCSKGRTCLINSAAPSGLNLIKRAGLREACSRRRPRPSPNASYRWRARPRRRGPG